MPVMTNPVTKKKVKDFWWNMNIAIRK